MPQENITIRGARQHNLKNIDVDIPRDKLVVITGLSGSGKSSLAFDTIYAEGQRRYVESLSAYARQFLGQMDKPDVDHIEGLSPAISIDQKSTSRSPRSTVGTVTEIYDYLRLLYARIGVPHCPECGREITRQTVQDMVDTLLAVPDGTRLLILGPLIRDRKGEHRKVLTDLARAGFVRARIDGEVRDLTEDIVLDRYKMHTIEAVVDRIIVRDVQGDVATADELRRRLADSIETALELGDGSLIAAVIDGEDMLFSEKYACPVCGISLPELEPRSFSFNSPHGACPECTGLGIKEEIDPELVVPDDSLSLAAGAIAPWANGLKSDDYNRSLLTAVAEHYGVSMNKPWCELPPDFQKIVLYGSGAESIPFHYNSWQGGERNYETTFEGVIPFLERRYAESSSDFWKSRVEEYMSVTPCPVCQGRRLKPTSLAVTVSDKAIDQVSGLAVKEAIAFFTDLDQHLPERQLTIARDIIKEVLNRLNFLRDVGLHYLSLSRAAATLSGGEAQRIRLATQIGSKLMGVLYILDEPSIGLHQRDNQRLIDTLIGLRDLGNTVLVVEHDEETIRSADYIIDLGPGAGELGGEIVCAGTLQEIMACEDSLTGQYLSGTKAVPMPAKRRSGNGHWLTLEGARMNNLRDVGVRMPLGCFVAVTGVSGSGKSSLLIETIYKRLAHELNRAATKPGPHDEMRGQDYLDKVIDIDQSPIGRTPRSNPATYTGLFGSIRSLFASLPDAKIRGYKPGRFSFNVKGGRCEACQGAGIIRIEMQFLPDVYVPCDVCGGKRYNREALEIKYKGASIADVLEMTVDEALRFFENIPSMQRHLQTLRDVGLGYIRLGQPGTTLSGGEAQRIKLARELSRRATGRTLYILDEPTVGLHAADVDRLMLVLGRLVDAGNTVAVIEHNLDVIKSADWIIDLGPEGGSEGGRVIASGTPEEVAACPESYTGQYLKRVLD